jgi:SynChlorMet cassette protein ScmC
MNGEHRYCIDGWNSSMSNRHPTFSQGSVGMTLADGSTWGIAAGDEKAFAIVARLADAMQLLPQQAPIYRLLVLTDDNGVSTHSSHLVYGRRRSVPRIFLSSTGDNTFTCILSPKQKKDVFADQLVQLSLVIAQQSQNAGGILLHGALIERDGWGIILAGPGGVGKTTASSRLSLPWRPLSDDEVLIVCDEKGTYWTHPWPTWSKLMSGGKGGTWNVNHAVPLKGIFFLSQAKEDVAEPIGAGETACLLFESSQQTMWPLLRFLNTEEGRDIHLRRFENICTLVRRVPCYRLHLSLDGAFWREIERVITEDEKGEL